MKRRIYVAAILVAVMAFQTPIMVFAEGETGQNVPEPVTYGDVVITDDGWHPNPDDQNEISYSVGSWEEGGIVTTGNVTSTVSSDIEDEDGNSGFPAVAVGNRGTVQVNGNVSSANTGAIWSESGGTVNVTGDVTTRVEEGNAVSVIEGGTINIGGNVANVGNGRDTDGNTDYGTSCGIDVAGQSTVIVGGDVTTNSGTGIIVNADGGSKGKVEVGGCVSSTQDAAIITNAASDIKIGENVTGNTGIVVRLDGSGGTIEVLGTVKSTKDYASVIVIETEKEDKDELVTALPAIVVGSLEGASGTPEDFLWISSEENADDADELYEAVYAQLLYYISQDKFANATLSVEGANAYKNGYTSNEGNSLTVTITTADGYEVSSVSGTSVIRNANGTYTVVVQRGKGIDINAVISAVVKAQKEAVSNENYDSSDTPEIVILAYAAAQKQFQAAIEAQQKTLPAGGTLTLDMKNCISFNKKTFDVLSQRKDVDIKIIYTWKGKKYEVVIPAGYDILSLLDENGYCGCLYLNYIFGSTELTK